MGTFLDFLNLKVIIPRRRIINSIIVIIISSTIFVGSLSVIYDLNDVSTDFLGDEENVVVIFNPDASTPFTSVIPEIIEDTLISFPGVELTSPEILQPVIYDDFPIYLRAGRLSSMMAFDTNGILNSNTSFNKLVSTEAVIGENLAERLGLKLGDKLIVDSIITEKSVTLLIKGILKNSFYKDEILVSLSVGRFLSTAQSYQIGHLRVKYDPTITSEKEIIDVALKEYSIEIEFLLGNISKNYGDYKFNLYENNSDTTIISQRMTKKVKFFLTPNIYEIEITRLDGTPVPFNYSRFIGLYSDASIQIQILNFEYDKKITIVNKGTPVPNLDVIIHSDKTNYDSTASLDATGSFYRRLSYGEYNITVDYFGDNRIFEIKVSDNKDLLLDLNIPYRKLRTSDMVNGSVIVDSAFEVIFGPFNYPFNIFLDNTSIFSADGSLGSYSILINTTEGDHVLRLVNLVSGNNVIIWNFTIDPEYSLSDEFYLIEYAHYLPETLVSYSSKSFKKDSLSISLNAETLSKEDFIENTFTLPKQIGLYNVKISAESWTGSRLVYKLKIIVDEYNQSLGWMSPEPNMTLVNSDTIDIWSFEKLEINDPNWILMNISRGIYSLTANFDNESKFLGTTEVTFSNGLTLPINPVTSYFDQVNFTDEENNSLNLTSTVTGDLFKLTFNELKYSITMNEETNIYSNRLISIPNSLTNYSFRLENLITGYTELIQVSLNDITGSLDYPNLASTLPSTLTNDSYSITPLNEDISFVIEWLNGSTYLQESISVGETYNTYFPFGTFRVIISSVSNSTIFLVTRALPIEQYYSSTSNQLIFEKGILLTSLNETIQLFEDATLYFQDRIFLGIASSPKVEISGYTITDRNFVDVELSGISYAKYIVDYKNGTTKSGIYSGTLTVKSALNDASISFSGRDLRNESFVINRSFKLNSQRIVHSFEFFNRSISEFANGYFTIKEVNAEYSHTIEFNSTSTLQIGLLETSYIYTLTDLDGNKLFFDIIDINSVTHEVYIGDISVSFNYSLPNFGKNGIYNGTLLYKPTTSSLWQTYSLNEGDKFTGSPGNYDFIFTVGEFKTNLTLYLNTSKAILVEFPVIYQTLKIIFYETPKDNTLKLQISHPLLGIDLIPIKISSTPNTWIVPNVPLGLLNLHFKGEIVEYIENYYLGNDRVKVYTKYYIDENAKIVQNIGSSYKQSQLRSGQYGLAQNSEYLNSYLEGSLSIINLILITEVMIVFIISFVNISIFLASVTEESINEIKIMRSLGFSHFWTFYSFSKHLIFFSILGSFVGQLFSTFLIDFFISSNTLIIFGHLFTPEVNQPFIIIGNLIFTLSVTISSAVNSYRRLIKI